MSTATRTPRKRSWTQDPVGRRARILEAAADAFATKGYQAARVEDIAKAADVAEGTVYHQFTNKRGLLTAVGDAYGQGLARAAFGDPPAPIRPENIRAIVDNIFTFVRETDGPLAAFLLANNPEEGGPARDANRAQLLHTLERVLADAMEDGDLPALHPRIAAEIQFGLVECALKDCFLRNGGRGRGRLSGRGHPLSVRLHGSNRHRYPVNTAKPWHISGNEL